MIGIATVRASAAITANCNNIVLLLATFAICYRPSVCHLSVCL